jgi:PLP dependent protein
MPLSESEIVSRLRDNIACVQERMAAAAIRAGREDGARLVAVTKYVEPAIARLLVTECGLWELAESRPQELWRKVEALEDISCTWRRSERAIGLPAERRAAWHLIGHLQRNKVKRTLPLSCCIDSADSLRLLEEISREAVAQHLFADVLIEVNVSGDEAKHGLPPNQLEPLLEQASKLPRLCVLGLMTMAGLEGGPDKARRDFAALRELRDRIECNCPPQVAMIELSMGMSGDYEIAIEEGATMVRVGSALFEGIV